MFTTLISPEQVFIHLDDPNWAIVDCRFSLADARYGEREYHKSHIPGAVFADLERDLSGPIVGGKTGRHPLPDVGQAAEVFGRLGIDQRVQVVAYDDAGGALAAGRLWWMLRWLGHNAAAVLDGGWQRWVRAGYPTRPGWESRPARRFEPSPRPEMVVSVEEVEHARQDPSFLVIDVRVPERYRGEMEPIDVVAGHIPGAVNAPYAENLTAEGTFRPAEELRSMYQGVLGPIAVERSIFYCGSGVTSIQSLLALQHAGLGEARLYAGSWSEWITNPQRPVAKQNIS